MQKLAVVGLSIAFAAFFISVPAILDSSFHLAPLLASAAEQSANQTNKKAQACTGKMPKLQTGEASWYGREDAGKKTASGEIFDPNARTAAHPTLPLGTEINVKNLENGKETTLTVNDRGPYIKGRVLDVSRKGADDLGFVKDGITEVQIETKSTPPAAAKEASIQNPQKGC